MKKLSVIAALFAGVLLAFTFVSCEAEAEDSGKQTEAPVIIPAPSEYTVTFDSDGGSEVAPQTVKAGETASKPDDPVKKAVKTSYVFLGWYKDGTLFDFSGTIEEEITLKAKWLEGFVKVNGAEITGEETWTPASEVFTTGKSFTIGDLYVCDHEVTQAEYEKYCCYGSYQPSGKYGDGDDYPAYFISWYSAVVYCNLRSIDEGLTPVYKCGGITDPHYWSNRVISLNNKLCGPDTPNNTWDNIVFNEKADGYRLPTEAEWEYIAREGKSTGTTYCGSNTVDEVAWLGFNSRSKVHEVKTDKSAGKDSASSLGIYDMSGNVYEWCWDRYNSDTFTASTGRILRGGSWDSDPHNCSVFYRNYNLSYYNKSALYGFRVVRNAQ